MVADTRFRLTQPLRAVVATALQPVQRALLVPVEAWRRRRRLPAWACSSALAAEEAARRAARAAVRARAARRAAAAGERPPARAARAAAGADGALAGRPRCCTRPPTRTRARSSSTAAPTQRHRRSASPVINEAGVLGQVTRVYPLSCRGHAADRQGRRDPGAQHAHAGAQRGLRRRAPIGAGMELRFMAGNADVQGRRPADDLGRRRRLPAGPAGRDGRERRPQGRFRLRPHRARRRPRRPTACATCWCWSRSACSCRRGPSRRRPPRSRAEAQRPRKAQAGGPRA